MTSRSPIIALIVAAGLAALGFFIGDGIRDSRKLTRSVDVRGVAERDVVADTAHLTINLGLSGNDRTRLFSDLQKVQRTVIQQLKANGIKDPELTETQWSTSEISAEEFKDDPERLRYTLTGGVEIATPNIEAIKKVNAGINDLIVSTGGAVTGSSVSYTFTGIGAIRAAMIAEATKDARNAALQFAQDSGSRVGAIRSASQGVFQITTPNSADSEGGNEDKTSVNKRVRVVTTVSYELVD